MNTVVIIFLVCACVGVTGVVLHAVVYLWPLFTQASSVIDRLIEDFNRDNPRREP